MNAIDLDLYEELRHGDTGADDEEELVEEEILRLKGDWISPNSLASLSDHDW